MMVVALLTAVTANAQFEKNKVYVGASLSSLDLSYNGRDKGSIGVSAKGGFTFEDDWLLTGQVGYEKRNGLPASSTVGVGVRYYIVQNGLYLGLNGDYYHYGADHDDVMPSVHLGYAFFLNGSVTLEPELYYRQSTKSHADFSTIGVAIGLGVWL